MRSVFMPCSLNSFSLSLSLCLAVFVCFIGVSVCLGFGFGSSVGRKFLASSDERFVSVAFYGLIDHFTTRGRSV